MTKNILYKIKYNINNMPQIKYCPHCKKSFFASTYQMINHYEKFHSKAHKKS